MVLKIWLAAIALAFLEDVPCRIDNQAPPFSFALAEATSGKVERPQQQRQRRRRLLFKYYGRQNITRANAARVKHLAPKPDPWWELWQERREAVVSVGQGFVWLWGITLNCDNSYLLSFVRWVTV